MIEDLQKLEARPITTVKPREDPAMLRGESKYTADLVLTGMLHMVLLRSEHGHATIRGIDTEAAAAMPGVVRIITSADITGKIMPLPCVWVPGGVESHFPPHPYGLPGAGFVLATGTVRSPTSASTDPSESVSLNSRRSCSGSRPSASEPRFSSVGVTT